MNVGISVANAQWQRAYVTQTRYTNVGAAASVLVPSTLDTRRRRLGLLPSYEGRSPLRAAVSERDVPSSSSSSSSSSAAAAADEYGDEYGDDDYGYPPVNEATRQVGLDEYEALKAMLLRRTWKFGALFSVYLFLVLPSTNASVMELVGCAASYAYLSLLMRHVDAYTEDSETPMFEAERVDDTVLRTLNKIVVGLGYSLNARLLIPVGLVAGCALYNGVAGEGGLSLVEEGCMVGGFLGYKVALVTKVYDDLKPKVLTSEELMREKRPDLVEIEGDVEDDMLWDGKKKR